MVLLERLSLILLVLFCSQLYAIETIKPKLVDELIELAGIKYQLEQITVQIKEGVSQGARDSGGYKTEVGKLNDTIDDLFNAEKVSRDIAFSLYKGMSQNEIQQVLHWLTSPLGQRITQLENEASSSSSYEHMLAIAPELQSRYRGTKRLQMLNELDHSIQATQATVELALNTQLAIAVSVLSLQENADSPEYEDIRAYIEKHRPQVLAHANYQIVTSFMYTYMSLTEDELSEYIEFARSEGGAKYHAIYINSLSRVLVSSFRAISEYI